MRFKTALILAVLALFSVPAWSQNELYQASANLTANLQAQSTASGVTDTATYSGGLLLNIRYRFHNNVSLEANGAFTTYTQYYKPVASQEQANIYEGTAALIYTFRPPDMRLRPFLEAGGGVLYFSPVDTGSTPGGSKDIQPAGVIGLGADYKMTTHWSARFGVRALLYRPPAFSLATQTVNSITEMAVPYVGLVCRF